MNRFKDEIQLPDGSRLTFKVKKHDYGFEVISTHIDKYGNQEANTVGCSSDYEGCEMIVETTICNHLLKNEPVNAYSNEHRDIIGR